VDSEDFLVCKVSPILNKLFKANLAGPQAVGWLVAGLWNVDCNYELSV